MSGAPIPQLLLEPIASDAASPNITVPMPESPTGGIGASIQGGFPAITMLSELNGGKPPFGQDVNGFLFLISSHTFYTECGQLYLYNSDIATAISGYLAGTILGMADGTGMWLNTVNGNTSNPDTGGSGWVPIASYGFSNITGLTGGTVNLTSAQSRYEVIVLQGSLVSGLTINLPQTFQQWLIINATTGSFTTTIKTSASGSTGVVVAQGGFSAPVGVYSVGDGNIYPTVAPLSVPIDQNATPLTIVERTNTGNVLATYFNQSSGIEVPAIGAVFVQNNFADGFLRKISLSDFLSQAFVNAALTGTPTATNTALSDDSTRVANTHFVQSNMIGGTAQSWTSFTLGSGRASGVTYTNSTGRPIQVLISGDTPNSGTTTFQVGGTIIFTNVNGGTPTEPVNIAAIIPNGATYKLNGATLTTGVHSWSELR